MSGERSAEDALEDLLECMTVLRSECPWDRVQTHGTLRRHLLEETHETLEALDAIAASQADGARGDDQLFDDQLFEDLCEELGDVLFQVVFHSHIAAEAQHFTLSDVIDGVRTKLVARHPAIFATETVSGGVAGEDRSDGAAWEHAKVAEKGRDSVMDGIPASLPALAYATKVIGKARAVAPDLVEDLASESAEPGAGDLGSRLLELVAGARSDGIDAESTLRSVTRELEHQVRARERDSAEPHAP